ncbi:MAG: methyltransferase domain-containing protein [Actinophytocola sp.]|uniref:methyltransferase domain-containing protein n=1 Tax=Actinophytocola sp. TaxID=1872138 RepID=UPI0013239DD0|nr:methyltransferase domain-containing protein [Actinophytocola sp.]MPZ81439.1 methyltransferase domain-containing protein [Actinophytocola sp.]
MSTLLNMLDALDSLPGSVELRARSYELLGPVEGRTVVDVGCGGGRAVHELGARGARAIGVDLDPDMIAAARTRWDAELHVASAYELPLGTGEAHGYRADKVLHALDDPPRALREARRVLGDGGRIVLLGQDWDVIVIDSDDPETTRRLVRAKADTIAVPQAARKYRNLLLDAGFTDPTVEVYTGVFTDDSMLPMLAMIAAGHEEWLAEQVERARTGRLFMAVPMFLVAARRSRRAPVEPR